MFGWRKRNDGFEWREYVRTTVLLRRAKRREQAIDVKNAAVAGAREIGERGARAGVRGLGTARHWLAEGATAAGVAAMSFFVMAGGAIRHAVSRLVQIVAEGAAAGVAWVSSFVRQRITGRRSVPQAKLRLSDRVAIAARAAPAGVSWLPGRAWFTQRLTPGVRAYRIRHFLLDPGVNTWLAIITAGLAAAAVIRVFERQFDRLALAVLLLAVAAAALVVVPRLSLAGWAPPQVPWPNLARATNPLRAIPLSARTMWQAGLAAGALALLGSVYLLLNVSILGSTSREIGLSASPVSGPISGRAVVVSGSAIRVSGTTIRLAGIEAPERDQQCQGPGTRRWRCGIAAAQALARLVRGRVVACQLTQQLATQRALGRCSVNGDDIAARLVKRGHVFAESGLLATYGSEESHAQSAKIGIWRGEVERPADYRAKRWDAAKQEAPDGCPIKGQLTSQGRVYLLPWVRSYERARVRPAKGERWFCSEAEAQAAGWQPDGAS